MEYIRPSVDESFLDIAKTVAGRSTCLRRRYGAVIVSKDGRIVSTGYNGAPKKRKNCCDIGSCKRAKLKIEPGTHYELCRAVHAEANAIINGNPLDMIGSTLYLSGTNSETNQPTQYISPCAMCQRMIINAGIKEIVMETASGTILSMSACSLPDDADEEPESSQ